MIRSVKGKTPKIDPTAFVSRAAYLVGDIEIGPHASVWPGVVMRADYGKMTIGARSIIQDGSILHTYGDMEIGHDVTIGHGAVCHARSVGDHSWLGDNCTLNDGVKVGGWTALAAGAVVAEDREVPSKSIAEGVPAKVIGEMTEKHYEAMRRNAEMNLRLAADYKAQDGLGHDA